MALDLRKHDHGWDHYIRDTRSLYKRLNDWFKDSYTAIGMFATFGVAAVATPLGLLYGDIITLIALWYFWWLVNHDKGLIWKLPLYAKYKDPKSKDGKPSGIMFFGNEHRYNEEVWLGNVDIRTHILYLGTTGAGKTEGLKSIATNSLCWGSGFVYIDGKADTDLWASVTALVRRFGRDDDLMVLNYMTGNSDDPAPSNTLNPFSSGSASYLTNMLVSLMPAAEGDNAMWKERAVSLLSSLMPALTWKRDHQEMPLNISTVRQALNFSDVVKLSRDQALPPRLREGIKGYLDTLPGYVDAAFGDDGMEKPLGPDTPPVDSNVVKQQHGYLTMQFTRSLQSLGNDYGYIFDAENADIDMIDIVLNRRILLVLIPALEKSGDETANLGKIVAATLKGMMGSTLGNTVEGETSTVIDNKPTKSSTPFITIFDEVGYYTTEGMGVMAAQARSLGFCMVYAAQDLPSLEKRVKEEALSIVGNCNVKIFGKIEDSLRTADLFRSQVGTVIGTFVTGYTALPGSLTHSFFQNHSTGAAQPVSRSSLDELKSFKEGDAIFVYNMDVARVKIYYANPGKPKAMRVQRMIGLGRPDAFIVAHLKPIGELRDRLLTKNWTAGRADGAAAMGEELSVLTQALPQLTDKTNDPLKAAALSIVSLQEKLTGQVDEASRSTTSSILSSDDEDEGGEGTTSGSTGGGSKGLHDMLVDVDEMPLDEYSAEDAVEVKANTGMTLLPDGLTDEVKLILKQAADTLKAGLVGTPNMVPDLKDVVQQKPEALKPRRPRDPNRGPGPRAKSKA